MFLSKISLCLRNTLLRAPSEFGTAGALSHKFTSTDANSSQKDNEIPPETQNIISTEKSNPDKLYKKVEIEVRGNDRSVLESYTTFSFTAAKHLGITVGQHVKPRKAVHERLTVLKAVHVQKKHRVQYEMRTYFEMFELLKLTGSTADTFLEYIQRNLPEGVAMKVTKVEIQRLPESVSPAEAT